MKEKSTNFNDFHFTVNFRGFSQTTQMKVMITMQVDHTLTVLFTCEFFFIIYASPFTNCPWQNVIMCMMCIYIA